LGYLFRDAISDVVAELAALGKYGVMLIIAGFVLWIVVKWCRRYLFIKQLRMDRVSVGELKQMLSDNKVQALVDVRSALTQAATGRIPGALTIDMHKIDAAFKGVPVDGEVILYCACPNEASALCWAGSTRGSRPATKSSTECVPWYSRSKHLPTRDLSYGANGMRR
jgi:rhodanese-related sulfurtransferase